MRHSMWSLVVLGHLRLRNVVNYLLASSGDAGSIPGLGWSPGEENGNPLKYSCLGNPTDRAARRAYCPQGTRESGTTQWLMATAGAGIQATVRAVLRAGACAEECATDEGRCMRRRLRYWRRPVHAQKSALLTKATSTSWKVHTLVNH